MYIERSKTKMNDELFQPTDGDLILFRNEVDRLSREINKLSKENELLFKIAIAANMAAIMAGAEGSLSVDSKEHEDLMNALYDYDPTGEKLK